MRIWDDVKDDSEGETVDMCSNCAWRISGECPEDEPWRDELSPGDIVVILQDQQDEIKAMLELLHLQVEASEELLILLGGYCD